MKSVKSTNWLGEEVVTYYDDNGNRIGETKFTTDKFGDKIAEHFDANGNRTGTSKAYTDFLGNEKIEHRDVYGYRTGESQGYTDFLGNEKIEHRDVYGHVTGRSEVYPQSRGTDYIRTDYGTKGSDNGASYGKDTSNFGGAVGGTVGRATPGGAVGGTVGRTTPGGAVGGAIGGVVLTILGLPLSIVLIVLPLVAFWRMNQNGAESTAMIRSIIIGLCPLVTLISIIRFHGKKADAPAERKQYRKFIFCTSMLFLVLEICFMLYTKPNADGYSKSSFIIFALCWVPKFVYAIVMGVWGRKASSAAVREKCFSVYDFASKAFSATTAVMEITNGITEGAYADPFNLILLLIPSLVILGGVITLFSFVTNWLFRKIAGKPRK